MPLMEAVLTQTYLSQKCVNRWNYLASGTPSAVSFSFALVSAMGAIESLGVYPVGELMDLISQPQDAGVKFNALTVRDVYSATDFYESPFVVPLVGQTGGSGLSPNSAFGFFTNRTRLDIRRGQKRFVGCNATQFGADNVWGAVTQGQLEAIAAKMTETLTYDDEGNILSFQPVIVQREPYPVPGSDPERTAYRYYSTFAVQSDHLMSSIIWNNYTGVRSQNSRQVGRGQ